MGEKMRWPNRGLRYLCALYLCALGLLALCLGLLGCGDSDSSGGTTAEDRPTAQQTQEERENQQVKRELKEGDFVSCGSQVFVNKQSLCAFAKNMRHAYYVEVVGGSGKVIGYHPADQQDYRVFCTGTVPHRCTGFKDEGEGIEPLQGALIFFSP
jgi:hypothetical protein